MAGELELVALDVLLADGGGHQYVNQACLEVANGGLEGQKGGQTGLLAGLAQLDLDLRVDAFHEIGHVVLQVLGALGVVDLETGQVARVAVIAHDLARTIDDGGAHVHHFGNTDGLQDDLDADAVGITDGDAHVEFFMIFTHVVYRVFLTLLNTNCKDTEKSSHLWLVKRFFLAGARQKNVAATRRATGSPYLDRAAG